MIPLNDPRPDLKAMFIKLNNTFFNGVIKEIPVQWNTRMRTCAGKCVYKSRTFTPIRIELAEKLFQNENWELKKVERTLVHEMTHAFLLQEYNETGHTRRFQSIMTSITGEAKNHRCHKYNTQGLRNKRKKDVVIDCGTCGIIGYRARMPRKGSIYRCVKCKGIITFYRLSDYDLD